MRRKNRLMLLGLVILLMSVMTACDNSLNLNFSVKKGDKYIVNQKIEQKLTQNMNGQKLETTQNIGTTYSFNISDVDKEGLTTIDVKYEAININTSGSSGNIQYDSTKDSSIQSPYSSLLGKGFTLKINKAGNVESIEGVDSLMEELVQNINITDKKLKDTFLQTFKQFIGDDVLKESFSQMVNIYPAKKVNVGESWENTQTVTAGYPVVINNKWTLEEEKGDSVILGVNSKIESNDAAKAVDMLGFKVKYKFDGEQNGSYKLNKSNGLIQHGEVNQKLNGNMEFEAGSLLQKGITIPVTIDSTMVYEMKKSK